MCASFPANTHTHTHVLAVVPDVNYDSRKDELSLVCDEGKSVLPVSEQFEWVARGGRRRGLRLSTV